MHNSEHIPSITDGIFFTVPPKLPRGPHGLDREAVLDINRERLMIAFTELVAAHGYAATGVKEVVARSKVSRSSFYECFEDKEQCADAAYERFITVLTQKMIAHLAYGDIEADVTRILIGYLTTLQSDLVVARAFQGEMDAAGKIARDRRRAALHGLAAVLHAEHRRQCDTDATLDPDLPAEVFVASVYAARQLASDLLDTEVAPDLVAVVPRISGWLSAGLRRTT